MLKEVSQQDFYWRFAGEFQDARGGLQLNCGTKTPCVVSTKERSTEAREQYFQEFIRAVRSGRLRPQYCFAWPSTVELVAATLFSPDDQERREQREQLQEVKSLVDQGFLDLRWCPHIAFDSGIVGPKIAMIHRKDSSGLHTVAVEFATDREADRRAEPFIAFTEQLEPLDNAGFRRLVEESKVKYITRKVASHVDKALRQLGADLLELRRVEAATLEALKISTTPTQSDLCNILDCLLPDHQKASRQLLARIIADGLDRHMGVVDSPQTILAESPVKVTVPEGQERPRVDFASTGVKVNDSDVEIPYNNAWRMAEYFIWKGDRVHWSEGYVFYPLWHKKGVKNGRKQFREKLKTYAGDLRKEYGINLEFKKDKPSNPNFWHLTKYNVSTNIPKAEEFYNEADRLFGQGRLVDATDELRKALAAYPNYLQGHLLLARCFEEQNFDNVSSHEIGDLLRSSWDYLRKKCAVLDDIADIAMKKNDVELQVLLATLDSDPLYSQLAQHTSVLGKWLTRRDVSEDLPVLLELQRLLKTIASGPDDSAKKENVAAFCRIPCVKDVLRSMGQDWTVLAAALFYSEVDKELQSYRLPAFAKQIFESIADFQRYFRNVLTSLRKAMEAQERLPQAAALEKMDGRIRQVNRLEEELQVERSAEITDEILTEEIEARWGWGPALIKEILLYRKDRLTYYGDMSFLEEYADNERSRNEQPD